MKRLQTNLEKKSKQLKLSASAAKAFSSDEEVNSSLATPKKFTSFLSLESSMKDEKIQVFKNEKFVCIKDKYPKAKIHFLLIPHGDTFPKLLKVADIIKLPKSVEILKEMKDISDKIINDKFPDDLKKKALCGFHSIQSMQPLHMHIISSDFQSDCLKNKKHWNSFNTDYFIKLGDLIQNLEEENDYFKSDKFNLNKQDLLKKYMDLPLKCNVCHVEQKNLPTLKRHILTHK
ncbi:unnamed protein product [Brachionus calyciflorus]|uniref:Aprataxin C2HE/C2H2/C2HC zinc finger domain-containing protein n=1 Tax=Brachionus calyciflorus TaxID=104777 RepID=A0A814JTU5_9BILA|nr:unnamed protein product [Brachionus calyciflorus]